MAHRALSIIDIVRLILDQIGDDKPTLSRLARCCRAFHDPSLDNLWRNLPSVFPLLHILPPTENDGTIVNTAGHEEIWKRFDWYARRVQAWVHSNADLPFYCRRLEDRPGVISFPSLRELVLDAWIEPPAILLFPPSLRRLRIIFNYWQRSGARRDEHYLFAAVDQVHFLEELSLYGPVPLAPLARLSELRCLHSLELFKVELPAGAMAILSTLPALTNLELPKTGWPDAPSIGFCHLKSLTLTGRAPKVIELLDSLITTNLRSITIRNSRFDFSPSSLTEWQQCFERIKRFERSMRSFAIEAVAGDDGLSAVELYEPLMCLHHLEEVRLFELVILSVQVVSAMTSAWPHLKRMTLHLPPIFADSSEDTNNPHLYALHCLTFFARHCPKLTYLDMGIGDQDLPTESQFPLLSHGLAELRLCAPYVRDYTHLARLLDRIFPTLVDVRLTDADHEIGSGGTGST